MMIVKFQKTLALCLSLMVLLMLPSSAQAAVQASVDRAVVYDGESFTLTIRSDGKQKAMPDLSLLEKDFYILGSGSSQQVQIRNGVTSSSTSWNITLQPKASGQFHIPSMRIGNELTNPIQLTVKAPPVASSVMDGQHIFIETEIESPEKPVYLQQQIIYTVRLVFDRPILEGSLSDPAPVNALVEQLGKNNRYSTQRNGSSFTVIERRYAIFPEKSGELIIPPLRFVGSLVSEQRRRARPSLIDPSMQQFFGGDPFAGAFDRGKPVTVQGKPVSINVLPRPASFSARNWLPSAELELRDSWVDQPPEFKVGEPVTRSITIQAKGLLATLLPALDVAEVDGVKVYPEKPESETRTDGTWVYGIKKQSLSYMPTRAGTLLIPELKLSWWDTEAGLERTAVLPAWSVNVLPGKGQPADTAIQAEAEASKKQQEKSSSYEGEADSDSQPGRKEWEIKTSQKSGLLILVVIALIYILYRSRKRGSGNRMSENSTQSVIERMTPAPVRSQRELSKKLQDACESSNARAAADALLEMAAQIKPDNPPKTLPALASMLEQGSEDLIKLDRFLYATDDVAWDGRAFCERFKKGLSFRKNSKSAHDILEPLYPG